MLRATSLRSRVAQRIFSVFLLCALLPFAGLVLIAYYQVVTFFETKNQSQLRDLAKLFGTEVHERLSLLEATLQIIASTIKATGAPPNEDLLGSMWRNYSDQWEALSLVATHGEHRRISGQLDFSPEFTPAERKHLIAGKALVSVLPGSQDRPARILLSIHVHPKRPESALLVGEIKDSYLWGFKDSRILPSHIQPCVQDSNGVGLMCSSAALAGLPETLKPDIGRSAIGDIEWIQGGRQFMASYWTVPMKYEFQAPGWIVLLTTSKEGAFASIRDLQRTFILTIVASVGLSILLAIYQIRKRLVPVEKLQEATRRIAENDFEFKVQIQSNDEFDELAASLNSMADQLGRQFKTITTAGEIDRAVLSLLDTAKIVETILGRISEALHCDLGCLTLLTAGGSQARQWSLQWDGELDSEFERHPPSARYQQSESPSRPPRRFKVSDQSWPSEATKDRSPFAYAVSQSKTPIATSDAELFYLADESGAHREGFNSCLGAPLIIKDQVLGVLTFYTSERRKFTAEETDFVKRLTNQAAIAIYNSQLYERTNRQATELLQANKAKDEFLSVMSHELRTPLNIMMGYLSILQDKLLGELTGEQSLAVETIAKHSQELLALINTVMEATLIQSGAILRDQQPLNPADILGNLKSQIVLPPENSLEIAWQCDTELPTIVSDGPKLERILNILIHNAIKFTAEGSVTILANYSPDHGAIVFKVADTGIGIPEDSRDRIFDLFRQVDNSGTREYGGLGLGLFIAKQFANLIGAQIHVESQVGQGSMFTLTVPLGADTNDTALASDTVLAAVVA